MVTFMRIVLFLLLKAGLSGGGAGSTAGGTTAWENVLAMPGSLSIEGDPKSIEEALTICTLYNPAEINREPGISNNEPMPTFRASLRFDTVKPGLEKQISERLLQQFAGRIRFNWTYLYDI